MLFQKIVLFMALDEVLSYHFYNPSTHDILTKSSLNNVPSGYKLLPPPKASRKRTRSQRGNKNGRCTDAGFTCNSPFDKSQTFQYECENDNNCPRNYKCCAQKCFLHKICVKAISQTRPSGVNNNIRFGKCEKWPYNCQNPYDYSLTSAFKCNYDKQCPRNFKCCQQSCFLHKICSRVVTDIENISYDRNKTVDKSVPDISKITTEADEYLTSTETEEYTTKTEEEFASEDDYGRDEFTTNEDLTTNPTTEITTASTTEIEEEYGNKPENKTEGSVVPEFDYEYEGEDEDEDGDEDEDVDDEDEEDGNYYGEPEEENGNKTYSTDTTDTAEENIVNVPSELSRRLNPDNNSKEISVKSESSSERKAEYQSFYDKQSTTGLFLTTTKTVNGKKRTTPSIKSPNSLDPNAINPEYAAYYYYYDDNDKDDNDDKYFQ